MNMKPILTIAIPTYNRASYLEINLNQLFKNIELLENPNEIEIIISDNASTDETESIINKFKNEIIPIIHLKNQINTGFDGNFESCLSNATGKYVWIFGDDELLFNNSLPKIIDVLKNNDVGCVYINGVGYEKSFDLTKYDFIQPEKIEFVSKQTYIEKISYFITFCTGNIINKNYLSKNIDTKKYIGTNLNQVHSYLDVLNNCNNHIILKENYFFIKASNTGGYNLFKTFSTNFNLILKQHLDKKNIRLINNQLINNFFPFYLTNSNAFTNEKSYLELFKNYYDYPLFWKKIIFYQKIKNIRSKIRIRHRIKMVLLKRYNSILQFKEEQELVKLKQSFKKVGRNFYLGKDYRVINPKHIEIGDNFYSLERFRIEAFNIYGNQIFTPNIIIGNNVCFNTDIHIGCIDSIVIGDNCLFASRIYITDHHHGEPTAEMLKLAPKDRPLVSKGPVIIKNNVWVGEGVSIMPNVTIGENSIIATNAVVTKDVPANCVVGGVPAQVIKIIK
jgi:acetyltransferase-like isoleucine patch superfamily enzyme